MLVSLQSYTLLHFKRKQLLRWNVCQLSEDRNIRNIPSVTKGETHTNRLSFRLNKHKVSYFRLLHFYFETARALRVGGRRAWMEATASSVEELSKQRKVGWRWCIRTGNCWNGDTNPARFSKISYTYRKTQFPSNISWGMIIQHAGRRSFRTFQEYYCSFSIAKAVKYSPACKRLHPNPSSWSMWCVPATESFLN